ncbi:MAG TPA: thiol:disulfide interchange protein DsbA/DsbL [Gammaproteobacteria bacterium]|nr:thiol:disulfide interchange protein DsbA/DsbL [Gammaproteobacteria bacterium]
MRRIMILIAFCTWSISACAQSEPAIQEGVHYTKIEGERQAPGQVEVIEFFMFSCPHCAAFAPFMDGWQKKQPSYVKVTYIPVVFHESQMILGKAYYASELLGIADKVRPLIFEAIHVKNNPMDTAEKIADVVSAGSGIDKKKFLETMNSFAVDSSIRKGLQRTQNYKIDGVPTVIVAGKYKTNVGMAGGHDQILDVMDYLVNLSKPGKAKATAAKAPVPAPAPAPAAQPAPAAGAAASAK